MRSGVPGDLDAPELLLPSLAIWPMVCLVAAGCSAAVPAEASLAPGSRVEMLESDFVVVVPVGSATVELSDDLERQTRDMASLGSTLAPGDRESLVDRLRLMRDEGGQVAVVSGRDVCAYAVFPALSIEYLAALANLDRQYLGEQVLPPVGPATLVELSVGPAILAEGAWADGGEWATYAGRSGSAAFTISCSGVDENDDCWRSFADALVWLEELELQASSGLSRGRCRPR